MNEEFYTPEACEELIGAIYNAEDSIKFVYSSHAMRLNNEGESAFTNDELLDSYMRLRNACLALVKSFDYYNFTNSEEYPIGEDNLNEIKKRAAEYQNKLNIAFEKVLRYEALELAE